jgi:PAS domain S-box-containing protein
MNASQRDAVTEEFLAGGGEMGARMRALDWSKTPLGRPGAWPQSLKTIVRVMLDSRYAMWMLWGPELTFFCNDAYLPTVGDKRDWVLGARSDKVWKEIWPDIGPRIDRVLSTALATWDEALQLFLERKGFPEETYHTFSYSPVYGDDSRVAGMLCVVTEVTERVISERRLQMLRNLATRSVGVESVEQVCRRQELVFSHNPHDLQFTGLYVFDEDHRTLDMGWRTGAILQEMTPQRGTVEELNAFWPLADVERSGNPALLERFTTSRGDVPAALWSDSVKRVMVLPVRGSGVAPLLGFLIVGLSPRLGLDDAYRSFLELVAVQIAAALSDARAYESERRRAAALLELDHAKTAFFSNVSHEFRTPLTLILGPLTDTLARGTVIDADRDNIEVAHRNSQRLLRLVNSLLDFSRIEAGRTTASFEPTDLAALTQNLASTFRSLIERAGVAFEIVCEPLPKPVYVDREMWEKILLNLLSNAFKFTLAGCIRVELQATDDFAVLTVSDTGVGVPPKEIPRLFERFHRVQSTQGRTHEGTGIGLALVQELVKLHGGSIYATSVLGEGTVFTLRIPFGIQHVPADQMRTVPSASATLVHGQAFVHEASRWLTDAEDADKHRPISGPSRLDRRFASTFGARIVLVDDNADMRTYVRDLLAPLYEVEAVADGVEALEAARRVRPALIIADVMMPNLDGFGLLERIRSEEELQGIPFILLSARSGEESRIEGLDAGADDYLVKPFAARELLARVGALLELTQMRQVSEERLRLAIDGANMSTWDVDLQTGRAHWSATHFELLGYRPRPDGVGSFELWHQRLHPEDTARIDALFAQAANARSVYRTEHRIIRADTGEVRWLSAYGRFLGDGPGPARRSVGIMFDITERKRAEETLRDADRRKDEFLATLAHELRNPLAPVRNAAQILAADHLQPEQLAWCREVIRRQTQQMSLLLDDLLDVSRITLGRLQLKKEPVDLAGLVASAAETARPLIDGRGHRFKVQLPQKPVLLEADPLRITQALANLLNNAAKYTDPGGDIELSVRILDDSVEITVTDSGIGLARADLDRIFTMFSQVESALHRSQDGLGIGLALVKGLVELHGGSIRAESEGVGHGCRFIMRLPGLSLLKVGESPRPPSVVATSERSYRILVADDNIDAAETLAILLQMDGHEVRTADNGADAFALAEIFRPHVAFIDIGMPQLNGYEVAQLVRQQPWGASIRLVALTGWGQDDNKRQAQESGFDRHLTKPVDPNDLVPLLQRLLDDRPEAD